MRLQYVLVIVAGLASISAAAFAAPEIAALSDLIPDRQYIIPDDVIESVWDSKLAIMLFLTLILIEWIMRKKYGLT